MAINTFAAGVTPPHTLPYSTPSALWSASRRLGSPLLCRPKISLNYTLLLGHRKYCRWLIHFYASASLDWLKAQFSTCPFIQFLPPSPILWIWYFEKELATASWHKWPTWLGYETIKGQRSRSQDAEIGQTCDHPYFEKECADVAANNGTSGPYGTRRRSSQHLRPGGQRAESQDAKVRFGELVEASVWSPSGQVAFLVENRGLHLATNRCLLLQRYCLW